ncbi:MAG: helicase-related protein, partial [Bacteroidota bacterium]
MVDPAEIAVARKNVGSANVEHIFYVVSARDRYEVLKRIADSNPDIYSIVFCRTRKETQEVARLLRQDGYNADALHGDLSQPQRDEVMSRFRTRHLQMLVATDVAARGLDVNELTHVINFNLPDNYETYTHRSGRTGRAGRNGISIAIVHGRETYKIRDIERVSKIKFTKGRVPTGPEICEKQLYALVDRIQKVEVNKEQISPYLPTILEKLEGMTREELIEHFVSEEFNRFLTYYKNARDINLPERGKNNRRDNNSNRRRPTFSRMSINVGRAQDLHPARLIGLINEGLGHGHARIGRIDIRAKDAVFEVEEQSAGMVERALQGQQFEGRTIQVTALRGGGGRGGYQGGGRGGNYGGKKRYGGGGGGSFKSRGGGGKGRRQRGK